MIEYQLLETANQKFTVVVDGHVFDFSLRTFRDMMYISCTVDGVHSENGILCIPNAKLFSNWVKTQTGGNFKFVCREDDYPHYTKLNGYDVKFVFFTED